MRFTILMCYNPRLNGTNELPNDNNHLWKIAIKLIKLIHLKWEGVGWVFPADEIGYQPPLRWPTRFDIFSNSFKVK